jgi:hypothetical protein
LNHVTLSLLRKRHFGIEAQASIGRPSPPTEGMIMKTIAKVIESMLTKDATQQWTGQTSAVGSRDGWQWGGFAG